MHRIVRRIHRSDRVDSTTTDRLEASIARGCGSQNSHDHIDRIGHLECVWRVTRGMGGDDQQSVQRMHGHHDHHASTGAPDSAIAIHTGSCEGGISP